MSRDNGDHWETRRFDKASQRTLLSIDFVDEHFGYAIGSGGLFLTTSDAGETWNEHPGIKSTILQAFFADPEHGLVRTTESVSFTSDGGQHWARIPEQQNADDVREFPYIFSLVALDSAHMAVMLKAGPQEFYAQAFLLTQDSGDPGSFSIFQM